MRGITTEHMKIMREYIKKKDAHSFKKFVGVRNEITSAIKDTMKMWVSDKEMQEKISKEIDKHFTKENLKSTYWVEKYQTTHNLDLFFKWMLD